MNGKKNKLIEIFEDTQRFYKDAVNDYRQNFRLIEFAVYCRENETENYDVFRSAIKG